ncbi:NAD(P)-dependent dehydrogenase (short-subunit alcohol dehydrogenase family) [Novosphingobium sp. PhB57]|uniref:SDR family NAD(P)-dependent oxidoreductase n=1 Tax=Novosphingobium sp. PhB57 TaxID=2485107 RepID=UPI00104B2679|nr:SDR family oxidoreductase [Novosphingobium sp. PhB57]TCU53662.1 NAD(P)-dependent dehydrogenase (short-subunit alcohol dehydrogenase family) [Novosphingobium sp. PhB57]
MPITMDLTGRVAVITGGSRGLGRAIALGLVEAGAAVAVASRKLESCAALVAEIEALGGRASAHAFDAASWEDCDRLFAEVTERWGGADILVNNAGKSPVEPSSLETSQAAFDVILAINLRSPFRLSALFGAQMVARGGGAIVNVSSSGSRKAEPYFAPYAAAKAGLNTLTESFAKEYGPTVRVNTVMPGPFHTDGTKTWSRSKGFADHARKNQPLGRGGEPAEIVGAVVYLVSDLASYVTGACLAVDGGHLIARG